MFYIFILWEKEWDFCLFFFWLGFVFITAALSMLNNVTLKKKVQCEMGTKEKQYGAQNVSA